MFYYKMRDGGIISLEVSESVYEPREDSLLIAKALEDLLEDEKIKSVLEIGCGPGLLAIIAAKRGCNVLAADVNPAAVECTERNAGLNNVEIKVAQSDLFQCINGEFDLIVFNPPYLPEEQIEDSRTWAGGKNLEIISRFIKAAGAHLELNGEVLVVISSLSNPENILKEFSDCGFDAKIEAEQKIPWEKLLVICAKIKE
jgi:release factor glutamine methyltransferase